MEKAMVCIYCRRPIGVLRRIKDPNFCCDAHRQKLVSKSARAMRDAEDLYGPETARWNQDQKPKLRPGQATTVFALMAIVFLLLAVSDLPVGSSAYVSPLPSISKGASKKGGVGDSLGKMITSGAAATQRDDFRAGLANWEGERSEWPVEGGYARPTNLRIWKKSTSLSNYEFEFMGQIEKKSMDWAFRAADTRNYYATKLSITRPGPLPNAGLVRFVVLDGRERERVELPLPLTLERGIDYRVRVSVQDNRFLTSVNGQLVSSWSDGRLARGGVGFFSEDGESSMLKWVTVSERDSMLGRFVSYFSLISFPAAEYNRAF
jgi:hypothetical protein